MKERSVHVYPFQERGKHWLAVLPPYNLCDCRPDMITVGDITVIQHKGDGAHGSGVIVNCMELPKDAAR